MDSWKEFSRGAEAVLFVKGEDVKKVRQKKSYRIPEIDTELRKKRTRAEARILERLGQIGIPVPGVRFVASEEFVMDHVPGVQVKDVLDKDPLLGKKIGLIVGKMHGADVAHGDLTTSNMIIDDKGKISLIDFGLGFHTKRLEDKAVDIHLFLQALESRHYLVKEKAYAAFVEGYSSYADAKAVLKRLDAVEKRGRYKMKKVNDEA
jgi:Kae1-associated kinase Bud32